MRDMFFKFRRKIVFELCAFALPLPAAMTYNEDCTKYLRRASITN